MTFLYTLLSEIYASVRHLYSNWQVITSEGTDYCVIIFRSVWSKKIFCVYLDLISLWYF